MKCFTHLFLYILRIVVLIAPIRNVRCLRRKFWLWMYYVFGIRRKIAFSTSSYPYKNLLFYLFKTLLAAYSEWNFDYPKRPYCTVTTIYSKRTSFGPIVNLVRTYIYSFRLNLGDSVNIEVDIEVIISFYMTVNITCIFIKRQSHS